MAGCGPRAAHVPTHHTPQHTRDPPPLPFPSAAGDWRPGWRGLLLGDGHAAGRAPGGEAGPAGQPAQCGELRRAARRGAGASGLWRWCLWRSCLVCLCPLSSALVPPARGPPRLFAPDRPCSLSAQLLTARLPFLAIPPGRPGQGQAPDARGHGGRRATHPPQLPHYRSQRAGKGESALSFPPPQSSGRGCPGWLPAAVKFEPLNPSYESSHLE